MIQKKILETLKYAINKFRDSDVIPFNISLHGGEVTTLSEGEFHDLIEYINDYLEETYLYEKAANKGAKLSFTINAKGPLGEYQSIYKDVYAIRIGGKWYLASVPKTDFNQSQFYFLSKKVIFQVLHKKIQY